MTLEKIKEAAETFLRDALDNIISDLLLNCEQSEVCQVSDIINEGDYHVETEVNEVTRKVTVNAYLHIGYKPIDQSFITLRNEWGFYFDNTVYDCNVSEVDGCEYICFSCSINY